MKTVIPFAIIITTAALAAAPASAQTTTTTPTTTTTSTTPAVDVTGTWNATFNTQQGASPATLTIKKDGDKLIGTLSSQRGDAPIQAEVKGKTLSVWFNFQTQNGAIPIEMTGTVDGDAIKSGTMAAAGNVAGDWTATRDKKAAPSTSSSTSTPSLSGNWALTLQLEAITATPSLTLKQDGDKLTGEYTSQQYGKFPVTGSVKGSDVTFSVSMNIEGNGITAVYTGTLEADGNSMKGSVGLGDAMSGTFSATRKK